MITSRIFQTGWRSIEAYFETWKNDRAEVEDRQPEGEWERNMEEGHSLVIIDLGWNSEREVDLLKVFVSGLPKSLIRSTTLKIIVQAASVPGVCKALAELGLFRFTLVESTTGRF